MSIPFASVGTSSDDKHAFWAFVRSAADTAGRQALREGGRAHVQVLRVRFDRAWQGRRASPLPRVRTYSRLTRCACSAGSLFSVPLKISVSSSTSVA